MKKKNQPTNKCGSIVLDVNAIGSTQWNFFDRHHTCVNIWPNKKKWTDIPLVQREKKKLTMNALTNRSKLTQPMMVSAQSIRWFLMIPASVGQIRGNNLLHALVQTKNDDIFTIRWHILHRQWTVFKTTNQIKVFQFM